MSEPGATLPRSSELMSADGSALLVVDVQEKLIRLLPEYPSIVWNIRRLLDGATILKVLRLATEQYPQGHGPATRELAERFDPANSVPDELTFSSGGSAETVAALRAHRLPK